MFEVEEEEGAIGGIEDGSQSGENPGTSVECSLVSLAKMFENFMHLQMDRDRRQEKEATKQEQKYSVLTHQVTELELDLEAARSGHQSTQTAGALKGEPKLQRHEDYDDIDHFNTTFERLAEVYNWPQQEWAVRLIPLLTGNTRGAFVAMNPADTTNYGLLKAAVLKKYEINRETYRQRFRSYDTPAEVSPPRTVYSTQRLFLQVGPVRHLQ